MKEKNTLFDRFHAAAQEQAFHSDSKTPSWHDHIREAVSLDSLRRRGRAWSAQAPLIAAILAPSSTLFDIPAVFEHWYSLNDVDQPDSNGSYALSVVGLAVNIIANILLVFRFSSGERYWRIATRLSTLFWVVKTIVAVINISIYGAFYRHESDGFDHEPAFWCACVSVIISGIISMLLVTHYFLRFDTHRSEVSKRIEGRSFMISTASFMGVIALMSLVFSKLEGWSYFEGLYWSIETVTTIGLGDYSPDTTAGRILLLPFAIVSISLLAHQVTMIYSYFQARAQARKDAWRLAYEHKRQLKRDLDNNSANDFASELAFLDEVQRKETLYSSAKDLAIAATIFFQFWLIGAAAFAALENMPYGDGLYFCYIVFTTIGYGDIVPMTAAGEVFFVIYALCAVPIISLVAIQTVSGIIDAIGQAQLQRSKEKQGLEVSFRPKQIDKILTQHSTLTSNHALQRTDTFATLLSHSDIMQSHTEDFRNRKLEALQEVHTEDEKEALEIQADTWLTDQVIKYAVELEEIARKMLIDNLDVNSKARTLLKADRNVQLRDLQALENEGIETLNGGHSGYLGRAEELDAVDLIDQVFFYRQTYAGLLAAANELKNVKCAEQRRHEKRKSHQKEVSDAEKSGTYSFPQFSNPAEAPREVFRKRRASIQRSNSMLVGTGIPEVNEHVPG